MTPSSLPNYPARECPAPTESAPPAGLPQGARLLIYQGLAVALVAMLLVFRAEAEWIRRAGVQPEKSAAVDPQGFLGPP